ncbi:MAG: U32 family peptidase [Mollicutes bacterium]|nr:U32 family peptidase [Mollicutes bacterium]
MIELLAPAGDIEKAHFAFLYGADAIYIGGKDYSLRANATNFSKEDIIKVCKLSKSLNKKVYVTVNIVFHDEDLKGLKDYLIFLSNVKVDGVIVSDIVVLKLIQKLKLSFKVILSTQTSVLNEYSALFYKDLGVHQIVLARETLKEDIINIKKKTNLEIECFIHGAMCTSISGKCILSNYMTKRDSNRGGCAQICRWKFNKDQKPFTMTSKDLNYLDYIQAMIESGVNTFKVEGRMRSIYYIATVVLSYRRIIDKIINQTLTNEDKKYYLKVLNKVANRESSPQFFKALPTKDDQYYNLDNEVSNQDFLGIVLDFDPKTMIATIEERNLFKVNDNVEFIGPNIKTSKMKIKQIYDDKDNLIKVANKPKMIVKIKTNIILNKYDLMRKEIS